MSNLKIFIEILLSIHVLLLISSWFIGGQQLLNKPSIRLKFARLLFVCCVFSPIAVHCIKPAEKPLISHFVALDTLQEYPNQPIIKPQNTLPATHSFFVSRISNINYWQLFFFVFCIVTLFRGYRLFADIKKLQLILHSAIHYRSCGRLNIKVSDRCHIPFSVRLLTTAYIILPVSLLSSAQNVKIAIAHEGQHHRSGDCLWAYFIETIRIVCFGNPGVTRWHRILSELQELACDEALVNRQKISAHDYGHCLFTVLQTVVHYSKSSERELACTVGMALGKQKNTFITRRICMLPKYQINTARRTLHNIVMIGIALTAPICSAYAAMGTLSGLPTSEIDTSFFDLKIQHIASDEIAAAVKKYHAKSGVIAVADPKSGKIIAFAEAGDTNGAKSWKTRIFAPGSTIKPFVAAAAIDSGVANESHLYECRSPYYIKGTKFTNSNNQSGSISLAEALAKSVNTCFIQIAQDTGASKFRKKLTEFGFDMNSWWQSNKSDDLQLAAASFGETIPVTLDALTKAYAILANKGHSFSVNSGAVISETTANSVTHMLEKAVKEGTGKRAAVSTIAVAGKTGTLVDTSHGAANSHLSLFGGYLPANSPHFVIMVVIEDGYTTYEGEKSTTGGTLAAPVFHNMAIKSLGNHKL